MAAHPREISLEGWSELAENYVELARIWVSDKRSFVLVAPDIASTPALLGSLLVECAHTAAQTYASTGDISKSEALSETWRGFDEERSRLARDLETEEQD